MILFCSQKAHKIPSSHVNLILIRPKNDTDFERVKRLIGVLAHEMLHAYLDYYACICSSCEDERDTHHGRFFQESALAIEKSFEQIFGHRMDFDRAVSLASDYVSGASFQRGALPLESWGLSYSEVRMMWEAKVPPARRKKENLTQPVAIVGDTTFVGLCGQEEEDHAIPVSMRVV